MKYTSAVVIAALLGAATFVDKSQAVKLNAGFTDDLVASLAEDMQKEAEEQKNLEEVTAESKPAESTEKKEEPKKSEKKEKKQSEKKKSEKKDKK